MTAPFLPADFRPTDFAQIEPLMEALQERRIDSPETIRQWVLDLSGLYEAIHERGTRLAIDHACRTDDEQAEAEYLRWVREVQPKLKPLLFALQKRYLYNPLRHDLYEPAFAMLELRWGADVEIYHEDNIPLQTRLTEWETDYSKVTGAQTVAFRGRTLTLQQAAVFLEDNDRATRQDAWERIADRRLRDRDRIDDIFDEMVALRHRTALNAGCEDYRAFTWKQKKRFDYTVDDCLALADAVESVCMPLVRERDEHRKETLGVEPLRPWDEAVDLSGGAPLRPFDPKDVRGFIEGTRDVIARVRPAWADQFMTLDANGNLDLDSRPAKQPGGFQAALAASKQPFIFMNAAGTQRDVEVLLHEAGHALHYLAACAQPVLFVRHSGAEFAEVASMSMELLCCDHYDVFYGSAEKAARAKRRQLESIIRSFPWAVTVDGFQHWIYTHPEHTREQRTAAWLEIRSRFGSGVPDWSGHDAAREAEWHRQVHFFLAPFYYVEYAIAQLGALQVWRAYRSDPEGTLGRLREAFALGGTRLLPELFRTAGVEFRFDRETLEPLMAMLREELAALAE